MVYRPMLIRIIMKTPARRPIPAGTWPKRSRWVMSSRLMPTGITVALKKTSRLRRICWNSLRAMVNIDLSLGCGVSGGSVTGDGTEDVIQARGSGVEVAQHGVARVRPGEQGVEILLEILGADQLPVVVRG